MRHFHAIFAIAIAGSIAANAGCGTDTTEFGTGGKGTNSSAAGGNGTGGNGTGGSGTGTTTVTVTSTTPVSASAPGDLVISEIMNNPAAVNDNEGEWFEVYNPTGAPIDLQGLVLDDAVATHTVGSSVIVQPGEYAVLGANADTAANGGITIDYLYATIKLQNSAGGLTLRTAANVVIDVVTYDEASGLDPDGASRSLDPKSLSAAMNDTDQHWCAATSFITGSAGDKGTPGKPNDACP